MGERIGRRDRVRKGNELSHPDVVISDNDVGRLVPVTLHNGFYEPSDFQNGRRVRIYIGGFNFKSEKLLPIEIREGTVLDSEARKKIHGNEGLALKLRIDKSGTMTREQFEPCSRKPFTRSYSYNNIIDAYFVRED